LSRFIDISDFVRREPLLSPYATPVPAKIWWCSLWYRSMAL